MAIDKEFIIGLLIVTLVFIIGLLFFLKVWNIGGNETTSTQGQSADCARWLSENPPCRSQEQKNSGGEAYEKIPDKYSSLVKSYGSNTDPDKAEPVKEEAALGLARTFCNCP